ncbi:MAG: outer membrane beta-barrel domain-containing protein [Bdellovibrionales bacterium]
MRSVNASMNRLVLGAVLAIAFSGNVFAESKKPAAAPAAPAEAAKATKPGDEKVDISDLENKYWAPKDTDFSVVQNRTYTKEKRFFLSLEYGIPVSDNYSTGNLYGVTGNYYLSERHGIQLQYIHADLHPNSAVADLANFASGVYANHGRMKEYIGVGYNFVPFYSKMSFMGKKIIYFDMAITPTLGNTTYTQIKKNGNADVGAFTYGFDITQYFFFTNYLAARVDWKNQWYSQKVVRYQTDVYGSEGAAVNTKSIHDSLLLFGFTFFY